jgi:hypothetical protein
MFASGNQDARDLGPYIRPTFDSQTLLNLDRFQTIVKMQYRGKSLPAFSMQTPLPPQTPADADARVQRIRGSAQERQGAVVQRAAEAEGDVIDVTATTTATPTDDDTVPDLER